MRLKCIGPFAESKVQAVTAAYRLGASRWGDVPFCVLATTFAFCVGRYVSMARPNVCAKRCRKREGVPSTRRHDSAQPINEMHEINRISDCEVVTTR